MKVPVKVENAYWKSNGMPTGLIEVTPLVKVYSPVLRDYIGSSAFSPESELSLFPKDKLEALVFEHIPFECELDMADLFSPDCYIVEGV